MQRYQAKISGPILDRIDLRIEVSVPPAGKVGRLRGDASEETGNSTKLVSVARDESEQLLAQIARARARQIERYSRYQGIHCNAQVTPELRQTLIRARREALDFLRRAMRQWNLSVRAFDRALAVGRTIADLEGASDVNVQHVAEALQYRLQRGRS